MDTRPALPPNTVLDGSYLIARVVGTGGFGITYEAQDIGLGIQVAIKEYFPADCAERDAGLGVHPRSRQHEPTFAWGRANFLQEARTLARFEHPGIVRVWRVFEANATAYMVMSFEQGLSLETWLRELGRPPMQQELDAIVAPLLDALETMHADDILHRDIAPDNIVIRPDGTPVLLDFGAARQTATEAGRRLTNIVKAGYSPCEQYASDACRQGPWSDLYALGGTLYRAVTGTVPEDAGARVDDDRMPLTANSLEGAYRQSFLAAIDACLKVRHAERPQSVPELRAMLQQVPEEAPPPAAAPPVDAPRTFMRPLPSPAVCQLAGAAAVLAMLSGLAGYQFVQRPHAATVTFAAVDEAARAEARRQHEERKAAEERAAEERAAEERAREDARRHADAAPPPRTEPPPVPPAGAYDGVWQVEGTGGRGCRLKTWSYRLQITDNRILVPGLPPGTVGPTGEFTYRYLAVSWHKAPPGVFTGRLSADAGRGEYNYSDTCFGAVKLKRI